MSTAFLLLLLAANPSPEADSAAIKQLVTTFRQSVEKGDTQALMGSFWPDAVVFKSGTLDRSAEAFITKDLGTRFKTTKFKWIDEENLGRSEGTIAYVAQRAVLETTEKAGTKSAQHTFTFLFRRKDGAWKIAHLHWSTGKAEPVKAPDAGR